ncbi:hypothetical protein D9M72_476140 [compost metagenome]
MALAENRLGPHATTDPHAGKLELQPVEETERDDAWRVHGKRQQVPLRCDGCGIENGFDARTGLHVLPGNEIEQRPGPHEDDARADRAPLRFQRCLRGTERIDAGRRPSRERQHAIGRPGAEDQLRKADLPMNA